MHAKALIGPAIQSQIFPRFVSSRATAHSSRCALECHAFCSRIEQPCQTLTDVSEPGPPRLRATASRSRLERFRRRQQPVTPRHSSATSLQSTRADVRRPQPSPRLPRLGLERPHSRLQDHARRPHPSTIAPIATTIIGRARRRWLGRTRTPTLVPLHPGPQLGAGGHGRQTMVLRVRGQCPATDCRTRRIPVRGLLLRPHSTAARAVVCANPHADRGSKVLQQNPHCDVSGLGTPLFLIGISSGPRGGGAGRPTCTRRLGTYRNGLTTCPGGGAR